MRASDFSAWMIAHGYSQRSVAQYRAEIVRLMRWCQAGSRDPARLGPEDLVAFAATRPQSWSTRHMLVSAIKAWHTYLGRLDDPTRAVPRGRQPKMRCRALSEEDAAALARAADRMPTRPAAGVKLLMYQAMRRFEVASMIWRHVEDFAFEEIRIVGKGQTDVVLPLHPEAKRALIVLRAESPREERYMFPGHQGRPFVSGETIYKWVGQAAKMAGIGRISPHRLRHTALTVALENTRDLRAVQEYARHARPETTAGYTRNSRQRMLAVLESLKYEPPR